MPEWFEDEALWIETYPFTFSEQRFAAAEEEVDKIVALVNFQGTSEAVVRAFAKVPREHFLGPGPWQVRC